MILSGQQIEQNLGGKIVIEPFDRTKLNPNSYNLSLHNELVVYEEVVLDMRKPSRMRRLLIPEDGLVLAPNQLYLGRTVERTETHELVPMIEGRSSIGRLGLFVHITAGFGDVGFKGYWTLEMFAVQPIRIYPWVSICQIFYHEISGDITEYASGKYQNNRDIQPSLLYRELTEESDQAQRLFLLSQIVLPFDIESTCLDRPAPSNLTTRDEWRLSPEAEAALGERSRMRWRQVSLPAW